MACIYCKEENIPNIDDSGDCQVCGNASCTRPNGRNDDIVHGALCSCGDCGLICDLHWDEHAKSHDHERDVNPIEHCFGKEVFLIASQALASYHESPMLGTYGIGDIMLDMPRIVDRRNHQARLFCRYLNVVNPGRDALLAAIEKNSPETAESIRASNQYVYLQNDAFTPNVLSSMLPQITDTALGAYRHWSEHLTPADLTDVTLAPVHKYFSPIARKFSGLRISEAPNEPEAIECMSEISVTVSNAMVGFNRLGINPEGVTGQYMAKNIGFVETRFAGTMKTLGSD